MRRNRLREARCFFREPLAGRGFSTEKSRGRLKFKFCCRMKSKQDRRVFSDVAQNFQDPRNIAGRHLDQHHRFIGQDRALESGFTRAVRAFFEKARYEPTDDRGSHRESSQNQNNFQRRRGAGGQPFPPEQKGPGKKANHSWDSGLANRAPAAYAHLATRRGTQQRRPAESPPAQIAQHSSPALRTLEDGDEDCARNFGPLKYHIEDRSMGEVSERRPDRPILPQLRVLQETTGSDESVAPGADTRKMERNSRSRFRWPRLFVSGNCVRAGGAAW